METKLIKIDKENIDYNLLGEAVGFIKEGRLVVFPTETVYGLGANGLDVGAVEKIFAAKVRPQDNPLILHIYSIDQIKDLVEEIPDIAKKCIEEFWPGPLTILFKKSSKVPGIITAGLDTVAIRMPQNKIALELIRLSRVPIAAPSANISGKPSPTSAKHVVEDLSGKVDMIIDGGETGIGLESTVLDLSGHIPMILRPGGVTEEDLKKIIPNITTDSSIIKSDDNLVPKSPGQKYRHYAPKSEMILFSGEVDKIVERIIGYTKDYLQMGKRVGIMCTDETLESYKDLIVELKSQEIFIISLGSRKKTDTIAHNLFNTLRSFDEARVDIILSEGVNLSNLGTAIMNRMIKAASGKIIKV